MGLRPDRDDLLLAGVALLAGFVVFVVATELFPYHSSNHDEGVYLQQARLLLDGKVWFETPVTDAVHWWFFVEDGTRLYSKYQPVVPAMFALGLAVDAPRVVLALVGAGVAGLVGLLTRDAYDGLTGVVATALVLCSPLFLLTTSTFLPYAPTTLLNLCFAAAYVRLLRTGRRRWGVAAGAATGLAFFSRPYTAVLFAAPFVCHACWLLWRARADEEAAKRRFGLLFPVAAVGLGAVCVTLGYNALVTGDPLTFPFLAFAPGDGVGFGSRRILAHEREYTVPLAVEANARVLWTFATRFVAAPPFGTLAAALGLGAFVRQLADSRAVGERAERTRISPSEPGLRTLLAGVLLSVVAGNVAFWGNLNVLGELSDPTDGLIAQFGPFYHYDLLVPLSAFGAAGVVATARTSRRVVADRVGRREAAVVLACVALVLTPVATVAQANALDDPVSENARYTERFASAYEPFEGGEPTGVVFVPTPYGEWLGHPFQLLRNEPGLDGRTVYVLDRAPGDDFRVVDAYPNRSLYRYTYRGEWTAEPRGEIVAELQPLDVREARSHRVTFETGVLGRPATVRVSDGDDAATFDVTANPTSSFSVTWTVEPGRVRVDPRGIERRGADVVSFDGSTEIAVAVTYVQEGGATVTYRQEVAVEERGRTVRLVWPPEVAVCRLTTDCGHEGTYVDGGTYLAHTSVNQTVISTA